MYRFFIYRFLILVFVPIFVLTAIASCSGTKPADPNCAARVEPPIPPPQPILPSVCGYTEDDIACDFTLMDQHGNMVSLYDYYGKAIVLDLSAMWCGPCQLAAADTQALQDKYGENLIYLTVLIENLNQISPPVQEDLQMWAASFGIKAPILAGPKGMLHPTGEDGWRVYAWPTFVFIDYDMTILEYLTGFSKTTLESKVEKLVYCEL